MNNNKDKATEIDTPQKAANQYKVNKKTSKPIILITIILTFLIALGATGYYLFIANKNNQAAKEYLILESARFKKITDDINDLSTEEMINTDTLPGEDYSIISKKISEEHEKIQKTVEKTREALDEMSTPNQKVTEIDKQLDSFYTDLLTELNVYQEYYDYNKALADNYYPHLEDLTYEFLEILSPPKDATNEEKIKTAKEFIEKIEELDENYKNSPYPEGLSEHIKKGEEFDKDVKDALNLYISALEQEKEGNEELENFKTVFLDLERINKINDIERLYFDSIHEDFKDLREKAYNIKTKMIKRRTELDVKISNIEIESW